MEYLRTPRQIDLKPVDYDLSDDVYSLEAEQKFYVPVFVLMGSIVLCFLLVLGCSTKAHAEQSMEGYTVSQYVEAIYHAEGGEKAEYPYGIRSIKCSTKQECKRIAVNTVVNNFKRYRDYGRNQYASYVEFLGSRYCPVKGKGLSPAEKKLNGNWVKNVNYFLKKDSK